MKAFLLVLASVLLSSPARAGEADLRAQVEKDFLRPLFAAERARSRFSRALLPPMARRVSIRSDEASRDGTGRTYVPFRVEESYRPDQWRASRLAGCIYPETGAIYVKAGEGRYYDAAVFFQKSAARAPSAACGAS